VKVQKPCSHCTHPVFFDEGDFPGNCLDSIQRFALRLVCVIIVGLATLIGFLVHGHINGCKIDAEREAQLLKDPSISVEIQELPNSNPIRKFTRVVK
jgi:hypothetical protein